MDDSMIGATQALDFSDQDDATDDEQDTNRVVAHLNVPCQKGFAGKVFPLHQGDNVIGRGENCDICIPLKGLSREHACIEVQGDSHFIYDKGSRNRTKRNKHYLAASVRYELKDKDALTFGDVDCTYQKGEQTIQEVDDSGSETGSESMLQIDQVLDDDETVAQSKLLADEDEGADSDASSDILHPTQPSANASHMHSTMRTKVNGNSYLDPDKTAQITVMETPVVSRSKKLLGNIVLPESDEDTTDGEEDGGSSVPKLGTMVVADSQDGEEEEEPEVKSALIGAATQAYVYESDITTDGEETPKKKSLLMQPTQAYGDSDISTCSEESPQKSPQKRAFMADATQAYNMDEEVSPPKKKGVSPVDATVAYSMGHEVEPTQAYDMDDDDEEETEKTGGVGPVDATVAYNMGHGVDPTQAYDMEEEEKEKETDRGASILYEPTQAYAPVEKGDKMDEDGGDSDSSEEFILEGDTEGEEEEDEDARQMMVAPTLACDDPVPMETDDNPTEEDKTQAVEDATQVFDEKAKADQADTQAVTETDVTLVIEDKSKPQKHGAGDADETQVFTDDATQVIEDKTSPVKSSHQDETQVFTDDATQVFDNKVTTTVKKSVAPAEDATLAVHEDATQVFDDVNEKPAKDHHQDDDATQVFTDNNNKGDKAVEQEATQVFETVPEEPSSTKKNKSVAKPEIVEETQTFTDDNDEEEAEFDINAMSTLAAPDSATEDEDTEGEIEDGVKLTTGEEETQVFETAVCTLDAKDIDEAKKTASLKQTKAKKSTAVHEDATQVFDEDQTAPIADETVAIQDEPETLPDKKSQPKGKCRGKTVKGNARDKHTCDITEAPTQAIDETVKLPDATVPIQEDDVTEEKPVARKGKRGKQSIAKRSTKNTEEPTQVLDATMPITEGETVPITEGETVPITEGETVPITEGETVPITEGETVPITEGETVPITEGETVPITEDATMQIVDNESENTTSAGKGKPKANRKGANKTKDKEQTEVEDASAIVDDDSESGKNTRTGRSQRHKKKPTADKTEDVEDNVTEAATVPVSDTVAIEDVAEESARPRRAGRRGAAQEDDKVTDNKDKVTAKEDGKQIKGGRRGRSKIVEDTKESDTETTNSSRGSKRKAKETDESKSSKNKQDGPVDEPSEKLDEGKSKESIGGRRGKRGKGGKVEEASAVVEPETQIYGEDKPEDTKKADETATQRYGEEEPTQRYVDDEDSTPDIAELGLVDDDEDESPMIPKPPLVPIPSRSPHKSALASPEKKRDKSPSPRRVKFVAQSSESSTESTTRSRRGKHKQEEETKPETKKRKGGKKLDNDTTDASVAPSSKSTRGKKKVETVNIVEETAEPEETTRPSRGKQTKKAAGKAEPVAETENAGEEIQETRRSGRARKSKIIFEPESENSKVKSEVKTERDTKKDVESEKSTGEPSENKVDRKSVKGKSKTMGKADDSESLEDKTEGKTIEEPHVNKRTKRGAKAANISETENKDVTEDVKDSVESSRNKKTRGRSKGDTDTGDKQGEDDDGGKQSEVKVETTGNRKSKGRNAPDDSGSEKNTTKVSQKNVVIKSDSVEYGTSVENTSKGKGKGKADNKTNKESETLTKDEKEAEQFESTEKDTKRGTRGRGSKGKTEETVVETCKDDTSDTRRSGRQSSRGAKKQEVVVNEAEVKSADKSDIPEKTDKATKAKSKTTDGKDAAKPTRATRGKRKESDADEEPGSSATPAKRQKTQVPQNTAAAATPVATSKKQAVAETPKATNKRSSTVGTPKNQGVKDLNASVVHSPTLRKSTVSGGKAKVMFTGVVDEQGTKTVKDLGGELVSSVYDCTHLVTDQIRRTVKFLCCLSRGIPIVTPQWLVSSKGGGVFSDPTPFIVSDDASEKKFKCTLRSSLAKAADRQLLLDYKIHVTKSVKPEPTQMKDIIQCAGAQYLSSMPKASSSSSNTLIISCVDDKPACEAAIKAGISVVSAEFVLTGILRQEIDINAYLLFSSGNGTKRQASSQPVETTATKKRKR